MVQQRDNGRSREEERRRRQRREERRRRRRRARLCRLAVLTVCLLILLITVPYLIKNAVAGTLFVPRTLVSLVETDSRAEEPAAAADDDKAEVWTCQALSPWTYTTEETAPQGDIVDYHTENYSYEQMCRDLYFLQERYRDILTVQVFGQSLDNRDLIDAVVGSPDADKDIIVQYSMHAREHLITNVGMAQLEDLLKNYQTGSFGGEALSAILSKVRLHIIPMMNPDGVSISQSGFDAIRDESLKAGLQEVYRTDTELGKASPDINEYTATWKANARSVDLNRNFATKGWTTEMGTQQPSCSRYPGTSANSEPEVQALINLTEAINCVAQLAYHCHGRLVFCDYGMAAEDPALYETDMALAELISRQTAVNGADGYTVTSTVQDEQNPGGCSDYYMQILHIPAVTVEVGDLYKADGSYNDPPLSVDQVDKMLAENLTVLPAVAQMFAAQEG